MQDINKGGSVVSIDRLNWINSRHVRLLFDNQTESEQKQTVALTMPFLTKTLQQLTPDQVLQQFSTQYIWKALEMMKVRD